MAELLLRLLVLCAMVFAAPALAQPARSPDIYHEPTPANVVAEVVALGRIGETVQVQGRYGRRDLYLWRIEAARPQ